MLHQQLQKALDRDSNGKLLEAYDLYAEVIEMLENLKCSNNSVDPAIKDRIEEYKTRTKTIEQDVKAKISKAKTGAYISIVEGMKNVDYDFLYARCMGVKVQEVLVEEPEMETKMHLAHFVEFLEVLLSKCPNLKYVALKTRPTTDKQVAILNEIVRDVEKWGITLKVRYCDDIKAHILFNNGYFVESKCGLHFYNDEDLQELTIGAYNYNLRTCKPNEVIVYHWDK